MIKYQYSQKAMFILLLVMGLFLVFYAQNSYAAQLAKPTQTLQSTQTSQPAKSAQALPVKSNQTVPSAAPAPAQAVAQVVWVKGDVRAIGNDKVERKLQRRGVIYLLDTIVTVAGASGEIVFSDNTVTTLLPKTEIRIDKYNYTHGAAASKDKYLVSVVKGGFRTISGAIAKSNPNNYQVNTPVATIGVRGTQWIVIVNADKIFLKIENGSIQIATPKGSAILDKTSTDKIYATIDVHNPVPTVSNVAPTTAFSDAPPITPATSTLTQTQSNSSTPAAGVGTTSGGGGGAGTGTGSSSSGSASTDTGASTSTTSSTGSADIGSSDTGSSTSVGGSSSSQTLDTGAPSGAAAPKSLNGGFCIQ